MQGGGLFPKRSSRPLRAQHLSRTLATFFLRIYPDKKGGTMNYWLFKSEPGCYSWQDLEAAPGRPRPGTAYATIRPATS